MPFISGDSRANEQINLAVMHTIWMREHNRIASDLRKLNPSWDDEKLYQEARRINVAQYQHIVYKEWLPLVLGHDFMDKFGLWPLSKGYSDAYMDTFDPRITNEFAAAAFRFGHSLIPDVFKRVPQSGTVGGQQGRTAALSMKDVFFKPDALRTNGGELFCVMLLPYPADSACWRRLTMVEGARRGRETRGKRKQNPIYLSISFSFHLSYVR